VHRALKPIIGFFAFVGVAYFAFAIYAHFFLLDCTFSEVAQAVSPNGENFAAFEEQTCNNPDKSWSRVLIGQRGTPGREVVLEIRGTTEVGLTWDTDQQLIVSYPRSAAITKYHLGFGWGRITLLPTDPVRDGAP
jgi:hypothetical protein